MKRMKDIRDRISKAASSVRDRVGIKARRSVGASVGLDVAISASKGVHVTKVVHSSPAALSGCIAIGDMITSIDVKPVSSETTEDELQAAFAGEPGSPVYLEICISHSNVATMVVLIRQPPLEEEPEELVGELGFHAEHDARGCLVVGYVEGGAAWLAAQGGSTPWLGAPGHVNHATEMIAEASSGAAAAAGSGGGEGGGAGWGGARRFVEPGNIIVRIDGVPLANKLPDQMKEQLAGAAWSR